MFDSRIYLKFKQGFYKFQLKIFQHCKMLKMVDLKEQLPSIKQLRDAIPSHCFDRSTLRSLLYPVRDALLLAAVGYLAAILTKFEFSFINMLIWAAYACIQGTIAFGIFIVGHQCGHNAFSKHQIVNDIVGYISHTSLLVPYFSWQRSHYVHHSKNNHLLDNQSHQPSLIQKSRKQYQTIYQMFGYYGFAVIYLMVHSVVGWLIYLFFHWTGSRRNPFTKDQYKNIPNHFNPFSTNQLFPPDMRFKVLLSTIGVIGMLIGLLYLGFVYGFGKIVLLYFGPYTVTFFWLAAITWLQHTDPTVPHYGDDQWDWLKGAVLTIDRNYPWIIDHLHHRIGTTHVCHHIFPQIPHYHAVQATKAIIPLLGFHYRYDSTPISKAIWRLANDCHYVEQLKGIQYYKSFTKGKKEKKI